MKPSHYTACAHEALRRGPAERDPGGSPDRNRPGYRPSSGQLIEVQVIRKMMITKMMITRTPMIAPIMPLFMCTSAG